MHKGMRQWGSIKFMTGWGRDKQAEEVTNSIGFSRLADEKLIFTRKISWNLG
jgi:hypothetical protein